MANPEILRDSLHRIAYSTDASAYREVPYGVAYPEDEDDISEFFYKKYLKIA